jgi:hypothetical protein
MTSRKRTAQVQINKDTALAYEEEYAVEPDAALSGTPAPTWLASAEHLKERRFIRVRRAGDRSRSDRDQASEAAPAGKRLLAAVAEHHDSKQASETDLGGSKAPKKLDVGQDERNPNSGAVPETTPRNSRTASTDFDGKRVKRSEIDSVEFAGLVGQHNLTHVEESLPLAGAGDVTSTASAHGLKENRSPHTRAALADSGLTQPTLTSAGQRPPGAPSLNYGPAAKERHDAANGSATDAASGVASNDMSSFRTGAENSHSTETKPINEFSGSDATTSAQRTASRGFAGFTFGSVSATAAGKVSGFAGFHFDTRVPSSVLDKNANRRGSAPLFDLVRDHPAPKGDTINTDRRKEAAKGSDSDNDGEDTDDDHADAKPSDTTASTATPSTSNIFNNESEEEICHQTRAKLFELVDKQWRERGRGTIRLLFHPLRQRARLVMRVDGTLRVILNVPLTAETPQLDPSGDTTLRFVAVHQTAEDTSTTSATERPEAATPSGTTRGQQEQPNRCAQVWCLRFAQRDQRNLFLDKCSAMQSDLEKQSKTA